MTQVLFHGWAFEVDRLSTQSVYAETSRRGSESCPCPSCRNYVAQRVPELPLEIRESLDSVGIKPLTDSETWSAGPLNEGYEITHGWWHFIGEATAEGPSNISLPSVPGGAAMGWAIQFIPNQTALRLNELRSK